MKHFLTASAMLFSFLAAAQFPNLPYNPDENGDGLIGVVDLQGLLANYGNEFASAVVSEDGESAIVYMGDMAYPQCQYSCDHLPGFWRLPNLEDLVPVWNEVYNSSDPYTWLYSGKESLIEASGSSQSIFPVFRGRSGNSNNTYVSGATADFAVTQNMQCYCTAKQLPRVEYSWCYNSVGELETCAIEKVALGWVPLGGVSTVFNSGASNSSSYRVAAQAFWRWAE